MNRKPRLIYPISLFIASGLAWIISGQTPVGWGRDAAVLVSLALAFGLIFSGVDWIAYTAARRWQDYQAASVAGEVNRLERLIAWNNSVAGMDSDHLAYASRLRPTIKIVSGHHTPPIYMLVLGNGVEATMTFVEEFCRLSAGMYLAERRQWSEGSATHKWADALTTFFIKNGYAIDAAGNQPARWVSEQARDEAFYSIGVELN